MSDDDMRAALQQHWDASDANDFATEHGLEMTLPLLSIARRLRCSRCGERKAHCWPEPYRDR